MVPSTYSVYHCVLGKSVTWVSPKLHKDGSAGTPCFHFLVFRYSSPFSPYQKLLYFPTVISRLTDLMHMIKNPGTP